MIILHVSSFAKILSILLVLIGFGVLFGCTNPVMEHEPITELAFVLVPYLYAPGGYCFYGAAGMAAAVKWNIPVSSQMITEQVEWMGHERPLSFREQMYLLWNYWNLKGSWHEHANIYQLHDYLQRKEIIICYIRGWRGMYHSVVLTGIDSKLVYVTCPTLGEIAYTHDEWERMHGYARFSIIIVRK